jgi:hypothetical protein
MKSVFRHETRNTGQTGGWVLEEKQETGTGGKKADEHQ